MKASELHQLTVNELQATLSELKEEYFKLRMRKATEELPNPLRLRTLRKDIARAITILKEKERSA